MKLIMDERIKHRLVGLLVVISITAIFVPAMVKKSNHRFEEKNMNVVSIRLPAKPPLPKVKAPADQASFKPAKVAHVDISTAREPVQSLATISKAERLSPPVRETTLAAIPMTTLAMQTEKTNESRVANKIPATKMKAKGIPIAKAKAKARNNTLASSIAKALPVIPPVKAYSVQLALFSEKNNALALVNTLNKNGYQAQFIPVQTKKGIAYKVLVGHMNKKEEAQLLQKKLLAAVKIEGFVVSAASKMG